MKSDIFMNIFSLLIFILWIKKPIWTFSSKLKNSTHLKYLSASIPANEVILILLILSEQMICKL